MNNTILAIDMGAEKIKAAAANIDENGKLQILAMGSAKTDGFVNGYIEDVEKAGNKVYAAFEELQKNWEEDIDPQRMPIFYSVSGDNLNSRNIETEMRLIRNIDPETKMGMVSEEDIEQQKKELEASASDILPKGMRKISIIPQCYRIDSKNGIKNPKEKHGREIQSAGLLVTDSQSHIADMENVLLKALSKEFGDIEKSDLKLVPVASSIASSLAVFNEEYKETCVAVLDIGKDSCDLAVIYKENPVLIWSREFAGEGITKEIKKAVMISFDEAENLKKEYACAVPQKMGQKETTNISDGRTLHLEILSEWVNEPVKYMFGNVNKVLKSSIDGTTYKNIISQVILTGGTANLKEIALAAQEVLELPVKTVKPNAVKIDGEFAYINEDMSFTTLLGLCIYGTQNYLFDETAVIANGKKKKKKDGKKIKSNDGGILDGTKNFFGDLWETVKNIKIS